MRKQFSRCVITPDGEYMDDLYMKAAIVVAVALAAFSSFPSTAQQQQQLQTQSAPATGQQDPAGSQPSAGAAQLQAVTGELVDKLDSKSAKQGDSVVVKTKEDLKFPGGADLPKGSKLVGHVTNVQAVADGKENSQIAIQFDHAELKGGQNMAIESVIKSLSPAASYGSAAENAVPGSYGTSPQGAPSATAPSTPGMNGSSSNTANNRAGLASNTTSQPGQPGATSQTTNQTANGGMPEPGSIVARSGNVAIRATAIPGVLLANDINGLPFTNASGMLLGARRDIHLDGGTQMVVAIAAAPQGAGGGMSR
jgi:hypothetical protein